MQKIDMFCEAIMAFEGWAPGSRSYRNCNPGNLRYSTLQSHTEEGYAVFPSFAAGWDALRRDVLAKCTGRTRTGLGPESMILDFFKAYAPAADANHPEKYARFVADRMGISITDHLRSLIE